MIVPLTHSLVRQVAESMRAADRRELFATRRDEDPAAIAAELMATSALGAVVASRRKPFAAVAVICGREMWPGVWSMGLFATDRWPEVVIETYRYLTRELGPELRRLGAHRLECHSLAEHASAHRLLARLGAVREAEVPGFGRRGEDFVRYAWVEPVSEHSTVSSEQDVFRQQFSGAAAAA